MIIDCHGHYTTAPAPVAEYRAVQLSHFGDPVRNAQPTLADISDDAIRESLEGAQLKFQRERGIDLTIFSPTAALMGHHAGDIGTSVEWSRYCNDLVRRVCDLYPNNFVPACQLPQSPGASIEPSVHELRRCVEECGFVACNINPDPTGGYWTEPPLFDRFWYPLYEAMVDLDVPAMIHVSSSCNPNFHTTSSHYLGADTTAFMQLLTSDLLANFPTLRFVIPHGGGAVPYHWGRFRGLAQQLDRPLLEELIRDNIFFDTCVYHQVGIDCLLRAVPVDNVIFGSEMIGAVRGIDPKTGFHYDDTRRYIAAADLPLDERTKIFEGNARRVYPRLAVARGAGS